jgi:hypothetical protein
VSDIFSSTQLLRAAGEGTEITVIDPTINIVGGLLEVSDQAKVTIDSGTIVCGDAGTLDGGAAVEIRNCSKFSVSRLPILTNFSRLRCHKMPKISSSGEGFNASGSCTVLVVDVAEIRVEGTLLTGETSRLEISRFTRVSSGGSLLALGRGCAVRLAVGSQLQANDLGSLGAGSRMVCDAVKTVILSGPGTCTGATVEFIDVDTFSMPGNGVDLQSNSALRMSRIQTAGVGQLARASQSSVVLRQLGQLSGSGGPLIAGTGQGSIHVFGHGTWSLPDGMLSLNGIWTVTVTDGQTISGGSPLISVTSVGGAVVNLSSDQTLVSTGPQVLDLIGTDAFITAATLSNDGSPGCVRGRPGNGVGQQQLEASKANLGSLDLQGYSCDLFATQFNQYSFDACDVRARRCIQSGQQAAEDSLFSQSTLIDQFSQWGGDIHARESDLTHMRPKVSGNWVTRDAVVRVDHAVKLGYVGFVPEGGDSRGSAVFAAGWDPDTIQGSSSNKDSFTLYNMAATPTYSGQGQALILGGEPPGTGSLNFIRAVFNNIRILDSRDCYMDVTDKHVRHAPTDIQDDADQDYSLQCQNATEKADQQFKAQGVEQLLITSDVEIVEQAPLVKEQSG